MKSPQYIDHCEQTLSESTGMRLDIAVEDLARARARHEDSRARARAELNALKQQVREQRRAQRRRQRRQRRLRAVLGLLVSMLALAAGFTCGRLLWTHDALDARAVEAEIDGSSATSDRTE